MAARGPIGERSVTSCWRPVTVRLRGVVVEVRRLRSRGRHPPVRGARRRVGACSRRTTCVITPSGGPPPRTPQVAPPFPLGRGSWVRSAKTTRAGPVGGERRTPNGVRGRKTEETVALPQLTEEQRAAALAKAAEARRVRAELKERLKRGGVSMTEVLKQSDSDDVLGKMKVSALLEAMPGRREGARRPDHGAAGDRALASSARPRRPPAQGAARRLRGVSATDAGPARGEPEVLVLSGAGAARRGRLIVLAGPSGVGKSSIVAALRERLPDLFFSVSATTRAPPRGRGGRARLPLRRQRGLRRPDRAR